MVSGTSAEDPGLQHHFTIDSPARISPVGPLAIHLQIYETRTKWVAKNLCKNRGTEWVVLRFPREFFRLSRAFRARTFGDPLSSVEQQVQFKDWNGGAR